MLNKTTPIPIRLPGKLPLHLPASDPLTRDPLPAPISLSSAKTVK